MRAGKEDLRMGSRFGIVFLGITAVLALSACRAAPRSVESISLDFPYGETRLLVRRGGEARLFYAALPESLTLRTGVFDIDALMDQLQPRLHDVVSGEQLAGRSFGMLTLTYRDRDAGDYFLYDGEFADGLFVTACRNVADDAEKQSTLYEKVCEDRLAGTGDSK
jgi:hypothetical protein